MVFMWFLLPLLILIVLPFIQINNTCSSYSGYLNPIFSPDCYYNPDSNDDVFEIIRRHVGPSQFHQVETEDGHILGLFRIPRKNFKGVVLLEHPISHDSRIWVSQQNHSMAFIFWRAGYEVWLCNSRGTFYSRKHKTLSMESPAFWNYSLYELGYYDSHAMIEYVRNKTNGSKLIILGLSMGATKSLIYGSTRNQDSVKISIVIASGSHLYTSPSIINILIPGFFKLRSWFNFVNIESNVAKIDSWYMVLIRTISKISPFKKLVTYFNSALVGWTPEEFDPRLANVLVDTLGLEVSFKIFHHFTQIYNSGGIFKMYDLGEKENFLVYGQKEAPLFPLEKIQFPVFVVYGQNDSVSHPDDNIMLYKNLSKEARRFGRLEVKGFNHMDFVFGKRRNGFYKNILKLLERVQ